MAKTLENLRPGMNLTLISYRSLLCGLKSGIVDVAEWRHEEINREYPMPKFLVCATGLDTADNTKQAGAASRDARS